MEESQLFDGFFLIVSINHYHNKKYVFVFSLRICLWSLINVQCEFR